MLNNWALIFEQFQFTIQQCLIVFTMKANSADLDQTAPSAEAV